MPRVVLLLSYASAVVALNTGAAGAALSRRAALLGAASLPLALRNPVLAAEDQQGIVERAQAQSLRVDKAIKRATKGDLFDPEGQSCQVLDQVLAVDQKVMAFELRELEQLKSIQAQGEFVDPAKFEKVKEIEDRLNKQVILLEKLENKKDCLDAFVTYDAATVLERAKTGELSVDRVVQRAKMGKMLAVEKLPLECNDVKKLLAVDKKALATQSNDEQVSNALKGQIEVLTKKGKKIGCAI